jgi:diguanylate cyclase (GGDEF)-like protein
LEKFAYVRSLISRGSVSSSALPHDILGTILIIGPEKPEHPELAQALSSAGHMVDSVSAESAQEALSAASYDIMIASLDDIECALKAVSSPDRQNKHMKLLVVLDCHSPERVADIMKLGAGDCIPRPLHRDYALLVVKRNLESVQLLKSVEEAERYKKLSKLDGLTELYNHRHFHELLSSELERAMRDNAPLTVMMIDVDRFKQYNDSNGHLAGDAALRQIAQILSRSVRSYDIVARYGGEEFSLILPGTDEECGMVVADRLRSNIESASFPNEELLPGGRLTISIGIASYPKSARDKDLLIESADKAMYVGKSRGGNVVCNASKEGLRQAV